MSNLPRILRGELFRWEELNLLNSIKDLGLFNEDTYWFAYARQALKYGLEALNISKGDNVLVPDYICNVIESSFYPNNIKINYYKIKEDLTPDFEDIKKKLIDIPKRFYVLIILAIQHHLISLGVFVILINLFLSRIMLMDF